MPCQVPPRDVSGRPGCDKRVCVLSEKETSDGRSKHGDVHIPTLYCLKGPLPSDDSCFENISGESSGDIGLEMPVFCLY